MSLVYPMDSPKAKPLNAEDLPASEAAPVAEPQDLLKEELEKAEATREAERIKKLREIGRDENAVLLSDSPVEKARVEQAKAEARDQAKVSDVIDFAVVGALWGVEKVDALLENELLFSDPVRYFVLKEKAIAWGILPQGYKPGQKVPRRPVGQEQPLTAILEQYPSLNISPEDKKAIRAAWGDKDHKPTPGFAMQLMRDNYSEYARLRELRLGPTPKAPAKPRYIRNWQDKPRSNPNAEIFKGKEIRRPV